MQFHQEDEPYQKRVHKKTMDLKNSMILKVRMYLPPSLFVKKVVNGILSVMTALLLIVLLMSNLHDQRENKSKSLVDHSDDVNNGVVANVNAMSIPNDKVNFRTMSKSEGPCVTKAKIESYIEMTNTFYNVSNIRVFPRNGFLLGIIRHGGFLPNEPRMDPDLAVMFDDISSIIPRPIRSIHVTEYSFKRQKTHKNPFGGKPFNAEYVDIKANDGQSFHASCFYPYGPEEQKDQHVYYPWYVGSHNREGALKEGKRWNTKGARNVVVGPGNEDKEIDQEAMRTSWTTGIGTLFDAKWFDALIPMPFYHSVILVPQNYDKVLRTFYGDEYMITEQRTSKYESLVLSTSRSQEFIDNGPLPMCE